ncbi:MAG: hypothetical protein AAF414_20210 [Pseudomonadota bacterium]
MALKVIRSKRHLRRVSGLAWLAMALALLQTYDRPTERWVQSDSGAWFQLSEIAGWICTPTGFGSSNGDAPGGVDPFCGLCITGGMLVADLPQAAIVSTPSLCGSDDGLAVDLAIDGNRLGDRPPVRAPPAFLRLT